MQPSDSIAAYVAAHDERDAYRHGYEVYTRLTWLDLAQMREDAETVIRHRIPDSIEDKVARHLVALINTIQEEK